MTTDPNGWFLASQALDHRETVKVFTSELPGVEPFDDETAHSLVSSLARAGYALVRITPAQHERTEDLTPFLSRKED